MREEALRRIKEDRDKRTEAADRRRSLPSRIAASADKATTPTVREPALPEEGQTAEDLSEVEILSDTDEEMPGSNKKKRHASAKPDEAADGVDSGLKAFLNAMKDDINRATNAAVDRIDKRIDENAKEIGELKKAIDRRDAEFGAKVATHVRSELAKIDPPKEAPRAKGHDAPGTAAACRREEAYYKCRRTLKIWPIEGESLVDAVKVFLATKLGMDEDRILALGRLTVTPSPGKAPRARREVLVVFDSADDRDAVKAMGSSLAGQREVGMAVHVPGHLLDNLFALNGVGYSIKNKHEGVKRSIKFDDNEQNIYLDIYVAGHWKKITPGEARSALKKLPTSSASGISNSLSSDDISSLIQGEVVPGLTAVVVPEENESA